MNDLLLQFSSQTLSQAAALAAANRHGVVDISSHTIRWMRSAAVSLATTTGDMEITAVAPVHIAQWQKSQTTAGVGEVTVNSYLRGLKTMYSRLQRNGIAGNNPAQPIKPLPAPPSAPRAITSTNYRRIRAGANCRNTAIIDTLWSTGCRAGELVGMDIARLERWYDDGRFRAAIRVVGKGQKQRWVYWDGEQANSLASWLKQRSGSTSPALFTSTRNGRFTLNSFSSLMRQLRVEANVLTENTNPHAFRHAFAIRKLNSGHDLPTVSQWLGHSSPEFTAAVYCVRTEYELRSKFFNSTSLD